MPRLTRDDGVEIHWEEVGEGPLVILASYWPGHPSALENITAELGRDHRVVRYDARGTGRSTRSGPFDTESGAGDLAAVAEAAGGDAVIVSMTDSVNQAVRVAERRPDLARAVVAPGVAPVARQTLSETEALIGSESVLEAFLEMMETSYRGALQAVVPITNKQMTDEEVQDRIDTQVEYFPQEAALGRLRAWLDDDEVSEHAAAIGNRLTILYSDEVAAPWFPSGDEALELVKRSLPEAHFAKVDDGLVSRPDQGGEVIRKVTAGIQSSA